MRKTAIAVIVASWALLSVPASPAAAACPGAGLKPGQQSTSEAQSAITCLINKKRATRHLRGVRPSPQLTYAAVAHSDLMASGNFFDHAGPDGTPTSRATAAGYTAGARAWGVGENIGWGIGVGGAPRATVRGWMRSATHRAIMLHRGFRQVGVGVVAGAPVPGYDGSAATVTALFGFRKG
jgi:uncharacterized protein YkwD